MEKNYWQEYWDNYYKFMALYLKEVQEVYPDVDIRNEYVEVANLFEPSRPPQDYEEYDDGDIYYSEEDNNESFMLPDDQLSTALFMLPNNVPGGAQFTSPGGGLNPTPFISPGGGQFTINNCRRMAIVRIEMRRGFNPSNFFMIVDRADNRSIQGFRIACEGNRIRFVPMAVEYRNINLIECAF